MGYKDRKESWMAEMLEHNLQRLCTDLELEPPKETGKALGKLLTLNEKIQVHFFPVEEFLYLHANVCPCPKEKREEIFSLLMRANLLGQGSGGAALSLNADEKYIRINKELPLNIDYVSFKYAVEEFVNYIDYWTEEIHKILTQFNPIK